MTLNVLIFGKRSCLYTYIFPGTAGITEAAQCSSVLPAADAAAADQQRSTPQPGCCATGLDNSVNHVMQKEKFVQKKKKDLI